MKQLFPTDLTCESCTFFNDYDDERGRGWCQAFDRPARRYHPKTSSCELVTQNQTIMVELYTKAIEDDGDGYPVVVDSRVIKLTVSQITREEVEAKLRPLFDLSEWVIHHFWKPCDELEI
jgi:hypothetical protein